MNNMSMAEKVVLAGKIIEFMKSLDNDFISHVHSELSARLASDGIAEFINTNISNDAINAVVDSIYGGEIAEFISKLPADFDRSDVQSIVDFAPKQWIEKVLLTIPLLQFMEEMNKLLSVVTDRQGADKIVNTAKTILSEMIESGDRVEMARQYMDLPPLIFGNHNFVTDALTEEMKRELFSQALYDAHSLVLAEIVNRLMDGMKVQAVKTSAAMKVRVSKGVYTLQ